MAEPAEHDVKVLNGLLETTIDSCDGYRQAAEQTKNPEFRRLFEERSFERDKVCRDLRQEVGRLGGEAKADGSALADAHRGFMKVRDAVTGGGDDKQVIDEVERGEDFIKHRFEKAMKDEDLSPAAREAISRAYGSVKAGHDQVSALKHSMEKH